MQFEQYTGNKRLMTAAIAGVVAFILFIWIIDFSFFWSLVWGVIVGVVVYYLKGAMGKADTVTSKGAGKIAGTGSAAAPSAAAVKPSASASPAASTVKAAAPPEPAPAPKPTAAEKPTPAPASAPAEKPASPAPAAKDSAAPAKDSAAPAKDSAPAAKDSAAPAKAASDEVSSKPATLDAPREGGADDLKKIKGVGPKMEILCNKLGFYHFDQIANWTDEEVAWVDANLEGFKGRVSRDNWVAQAKLLAEGGETEFSKKVDKGGVY